MKKQTLLITAVFFLQALALIAPPTISSAQKIAAGSEHSLAVCSDSTVQSWGYNNSGQLGNGTWGYGTESNVPIEVTFITGIIAVSGGYEHTLALKHGGTVWAWGSNINGQLGDGSNYGTNLPVQVSSLTDVIAIAADGGDNSHALKNDGTVWSWGWNLFGQLGNGSNTDSNFPVQVSSLNNVIKIAGAARHSIALKNDSTVWAWGYNTDGELGNGTYNNSNVPVQVSSLTGVTAVALGAYHSLAVSNGTVYSWGDNLHGQLVNGTNTGSNVPVQVNALTGIIAVSAGAYHSIALKNDGTVWAWGINTHGSLGNGNNTESNIPVQVSFLTDIVSIVSGEKFSLALKNDGTVWAWGYNNYGQLGNGTNDESNVPVQVTGLCQVATSVNEITEPLSISVFPNPTSGNSFIHYTLSTPAIVSIDLYDVLGNKLKQLVKGDEGAGDHNTTFDARKLANGVYVLQIRAGEQMTEQKVVVMN